MSGIYDYCGNPAEDVLSPSLVLTALYDRIQHYKNELHLTDEGWDIDKFTLTVSANKEEYLISAADFGRPFFVETFEPGKPLFRRREIDIARVQDRDLYTQVSEQAGNKHSAEVFLFANIGSADPIVQVLPVPQRTATYRIWHERILGEEPILTEVPNFLRQFFPLLKVAVCMDVLPMCGYDKDKFIQLRDQRSWAYKTYYDTFFEYIQQLFHEDSGDFRAANSSRRARRR